MVNSTSLVAFVTEISIRDVVAMYHAAERPQDLDEIIVKVPSVVAVSRALADRDHRASQFDGFLSSCVKPSDVTKPAFPVLPWGEPAPTPPAQPEKFQYNYANDWGVACDLAARWVSEGYRWIFVQGDKSISRPCAAQASAFLNDGRRVDLTIKRVAGEAIVNAMRRGFRIPELCEAVKIHPQPVVPQSIKVVEAVEFTDEDAPVEIERIPFEIEVCPDCKDLFCVCEESGRLIGRLAA